MSDEPTSSGPPKKHRHDLGHEDHGSKLAAGTTKTIQALLGLWIALTVALVVYAIADAARASSTGDRPPPAASSGTR